MQIINLSEETQEQLSACLGSVYQIFEGIRFGRVKEGELLSMLIYGGGMPPQTKSKIENTIIHYAALDMVSSWTARGLLNGKASWVPAAGNRGESLVGWTVEGQNLKFSRVNSFEDLPREATNRKQSGKANDQLEFNPIEGGELSGFPPELQLLHTRDWDAETRSPRMQIWAIALKSNGLLLGDFRQMIYEGPVHGRQVDSGEDVIEQTLDDFLIKETGVFDKAMERLRDEFTG